MPFHPARLPGLLKHNVFSNTAATVLLRGTNTASRLAVLFLIARVFDPATFGLVVFAFTITEIAKVLADFGIDTLAVREFAIISEPAQQRQFAGLILVAKALCGASVVLGLITFYQLTQPTTQALIGVVLSLQVLTTLWLNYSINYFQANLRTMQVVAPSLASNLLAITAVSLLLVFRPMIIPALLILVLGELVNGLLLFRAFSRQLGSSLRGVRPETIVALLRRCLPIISTALIVVLYTRLDVVVLSSFFASATVGYYGLAFRLTEPFQLVTASLALSVYSHVSASLSRDVPVVPLIRNYLLGLLAYGLVSFALLSLVAPLLIAWQLPAYSAAIPVLRLLAAALVFRILSSGLSSIIQAHGRFTWITAVALWNLLFISLMLWLFIPRFGAAGAALALLIGETLNMCVQLVMVRFLLTPSAPGAESKAGAA